MCESEPYILLEHLYCVTNTVRMLHAMLVASYSFPTWETSWLLFCSWLCSHGTMTNNIISYFVNSLGMRSSTSWSSQTHSLFRIRPIKSLFWMPRIKQRAGVGNQKKWLFFSLSSLTVSKCVETKLYISAWHWGIWGDILIRFPDYCTVSVSF